ncbi:MAG: HAD family phosphatase [Roseburia sp.]|nr:HAD family phosphatase [Roseburia sp.]MCM1278876.1 HAD family phosphatase [Robinsoniella sp.]
MAAHEFTAVVFDMDGIIFDSERRVIECWKEVAEKYHIPDIEQACIECTGINAKLTMAKMLERYGQDFPYDTYRKEATALFQSRYSNGRLPIKPGVTELLQALRERGVKIGLASSTRECMVRKELTEAGLIGYFDELVCGDMVENSKPAPDIFLKACERLQVEPGKAYGIEDSHNGIRSSVAAGLHTIMVPDVLEATEEMHEITEAVLPSLIEVKSYLCGR